MATQKKMDKRILRTRHALCNALLKLVAQHGYDAVTVQMITSQAGIARTTFYSHFRDVDDLLFNGLEVLYDELRAAIELTQMNATTDWEHVAKYADFYRMMFGENGDARFVAHIRKLLAESIFGHVIRPILTTTQPRIDPQLIAHSLAGAQIGLYIWWLETDMEMPIEEIAQAGQDLAIKGLLWGLGVAGSAVELPV